MTSSWLEAGPPASAQPAPCRVSRGQLSCLIHDNIVMIQPDACMTSSALMVGFHNTKWHNTSNIPTGIQPKRFRQAAQSQIMKYNKTTFRNTTVTKLVKWSTEKGFTRFNATDSDGNIYTARKVILGTGIKDDLPNTPHLRDYFGKGIYWCPWCDGFEHRGQTMGILGPMSEFFASVIEVYPTLNKNITAYVNGTNTTEQRAILDKTYPHWETAIRHSGIRVENKTIARIDRIRNGTAKCDADRVLDQFNISFTTGESEVRDVFITNFGIEQRSNLASQLHLRMDGPKVHNEICYRASLDGVWAVGDITNDNSTNVEHAMGTGKVAAVDCHREFLSTYSRMFGSVLMPTGQLSNEELLGRPYDWSSKDC